MPHPLTRRQLLLRVSDCDSPLISPVALPNPSARDPHGPLSLSYTKAADGPPAALREQEGDPDGGAWRSGREMPGDAVVAPAGEGQDGEAGGKAAKEVLVPQEGPLLSWGG